MKKCEYCNKDINLKYKRNKFCSRSCAAKVNNKGRFISDNQKEKLSIALRKYHEDNPKNNSRGEKHAKAVASFTKGKYNPTAKNLYELSGRTRMKIAQRLKLACCICGWNEDVVDIHHIIARKKGGSNDHNNLTPLCPNHHRLAGKNKLPIDKLKTIEQLVGDNWKEMYYG